MKAIFYYSIFLVIGVNVFAAKSEATVNTENEASVVHYGSHSLIIKENDVILRLTTDGRYEFFNGKPIFGKPVLKGQSVYGFREIGKYDFYITLKEAELIPEHIDRATFMRMTPQQQQLAIASFVDALTNPTT